MARQHEFPSIYVTHLLKKIQRVVPEAEAFIHRQDTLFREEWMGIKFSDGCVIENRVVTNGEYKSHHYIDLVLGVSKNVNQQHKASHGRNLNQLFGVEEKPDD